MNCSDARSILLAADSAHPADQPAEVRAHLDVCKECCKFTERLFRLEREWKNLPMPAGAAEAKQALLRRIAGDLAHDSARPATSPRWSRLPRLSRTAVAGIVAACLLLAVTMVTWRTLGTRAETTRETAKAKLLDDIVHWNFALVEADETQRARLLDERPKFEARLQLMSFNREDRQFAENLLDKAKVLADNSDPLVAAEHFDAVAEQVQERLDKAVKSAKVGEASQWASRLGSIDERGVQGQLEKVQGPKKGSKWERIANHNAHRNQALQKMLDESPEPTRSALHHSMKKGRKS